MLVKTRKLLLNKNKSCHKKKRSKIKHEMCNNVVVKTAKYKEENHLESIEINYIFVRNK